MTDFEQYALPSGWGWATFNDVVELMRNGLVGQQNKNGIGIPVSRIETIADGTINLERVGFLDDLEALQIEKYQLKDGDILFSHINSDTHLGKTAVYRDEIGVLLHGMNLLLIRVKKEVVLPSFLHFLCNYYRFSGLFISIAQHAVNQSSINQKKLGALPIPLPPLPEQARIVEAIEAQLSRIEAGVEAARRAQQALRRYKASVLNAACTGRLLPQDERDKPADVLLHRILTERQVRWDAEQLRKYEAQGKTPPKGWQDKYTAPAAPDTSDLPELPQGWVWVTWNQIGFSQNGRAFPSQEYQTTGVKLLRPGNLHENGSVRWTNNNTKCMPEKWASEYPTFIVGSNELVINLTAQSLKDEFLGRVCITDSNEHCLLNQRIARLTPIYVLPRYLLWMFKSHVFRKFVNGLNTGSLIQHMFTSQLAEFAFPLPPLAEQERIVAEVERRLSVVAALEQTVSATLTRAARLRQGVLRRAFRGELVVQDARDEGVEIVEKYQRSNTEVTQYKLF